MARERKLSIRVTVDESGVSFKKSTRETEKFKEKSEKDGDDAGKRFGLKFSQGVAGHLKKLGGALSKTVKPLAAATGATFAAQFVATAGQAITQGIATLGQGIGAGLALLPAAALAGALAMGTLKVATMGVSDALSSALTGDAEEFSEAIEGLSPNARKFAREVRGLRGELKGLRTSVQDALFGPLVDQVEPLANRYLPLLRRHMTLVARDMGQVGNAIGSWLRTSHVVEGLDLAMTNVRRSILHVIGSVPALLRAFLPLVTVGASILPSITDGAQQATYRLAEFMTEAERTGKLRAWIEGGLDGLRDMGETAKQLGRIFGNVGDIISTVFDASGWSASGGILDQVEKATEAVRRFLDTKDGARLLETVWSGIALVVGNLRETFGRIFDTLVEVIEPLLPDLGDLLVAFLDLKSAVIDMGLDVLEPALRGLGTVLDNVVLPAVTAIITFLAENRYALAGVATVILVSLVPAFVAWAASAWTAAAGTIAATWPLLLIAAAIGLVVAGIIWAIDNWDTFKERLDIVIAFLRDVVWPMLKDFGRWLAETFVNFIKSASEKWDMMWEKVRDVKDKIVIAILNIRNKAIETWTAVRDWARSAWQSIANKVGAVRDAIVGAVVNVRDNTVNGFRYLRDIAVGAWQAIWDKVVWVRDKISGAISWLRERISGLIGRINDIPGAGVVSDIIGAFATGGVVPGPRGKAQLAIVHGGETILPTHDPAAMARDYGVDYGQPGTEFTPASGGGGDVYNLDLRGAIIASDVDLERVVVEAINRARRKGVAIVGLR